MPVFGFQSDRLPEDRVSAMSDVIDPEIAVREYLLFVENPDQLVDTTKLDALKSAVERATDPIDRLKALAQLEKAQQPSEAGYKEAFIRSAQAWAEANEVPASAFLLLGVERSVLQAAGMLTRGRHTGVTPSIRRAGRQSRNTTSTQIKEAVLRHKRKFTLADLAASAGGSPMTIRKAVNELIDDGSVERLGPDPEWTGQGRAPIVFQRTGNG